MFQKHRKLIITLAVIFAIPVLILLCCDISVRKVDENEETETETVVETVDPLDASALELFDTGKGLTIKMSSEMKEEKAGDLRCIFICADCRSVIRIVLPCFIRSAVYCILCTELAEMV